MKNKFSLFWTIGHCIKFYCQPFEKIIEIDLDIERAIKNIYDFLPCFKYKCNLIFYSLNKFRFINNYNYSNKSIMTNIYNNIICMPNLQDFSLEMSFEIKDINFHKLFFENISLLKLNKINLKVNKEREKRRLYTSKEELVKIFPEINLNYISKIYIEI